MSKGVLVAEAFAAAVFVTVALGPVETTAAPKPGQGVHGTITLQNAPMRRAPSLKAEPRAHTPNRYFGGVVNRISQGRQD